MTEQLGFDLFNRFDRLTVREAYPIYWELESRFMNLAAVPEYSFQEN